MSSSGGSGANLQVEKEETGIKINMEPHVNDNNQVTITVEPEVSNIIGFVGLNKDLPQIQVRKTKTTVRVADGQTVFIAGLLREDNTITVSKVPLLGDIPLLGLLFQNKKTTRIKTNLVLEITPKILFDSTRTNSGYSGKNIGVENGSKTESLNATSQPPAVAPKTPTLPSDSVKTEPKKEIR
jgi:general secretion pathway protein D